MGYRDTYFNKNDAYDNNNGWYTCCLLYTSPLNSSSYSSVQQAKAAVDKKYTSTTRIQAQKDGRCV